MSARDDLEHAAGLGSKAAWDDLLRLAEDHDNGELAELLREIASDVRGDWSRREGQAEDLVKSLARSD